MFCFRSKKKAADKAHLARNRNDSSDESPDLSPAASPEHFPLQILSFKKTNVRPTENAQKFISHSSPLHSDHACRQFIYTESDVLIYNTPVPLPSPSPLRYALPHPTDLANGISGELHQDPCKLTSLDVVAQSPVKAQAFPYSLQPLPPPDEVLAIVQGLKSFSVESIRSSCNQFSPQNLVGDDKSSYHGVIQFGIKGNKQEVVITRFVQMLHRDLKDWVSELCTISTQRYSHVGNLIGFHAQEGKEEHFLVYEKLHRGSLHNLMFGSSDSPSLNWSTRLKIAYGAAHGLNSLHEKYPQQVLYKDFRLSHIQVDVDYTSKVVGYYFMQSSVMVDIHDPNEIKTARDVAYCAPEVICSGERTHKSIVWSFGIALLELITGRKNMDERIAKSQRDLVKWSMPYLTREGMRFLIADSKLKGRFPSKSMKVVADIVLRCLNVDPAKRPTMKVVLDMVKSAQGLQSKSQFPVEGKPDSSDAEFTTTFERSPCMMDSGMLDEGRRASRFKSLKAETPLEYVVTLPKSLKSRHSYQPQYVSAPLEHMKDIYTRPCHT